MLDLCIYSHKNLIADGIFLFYVLGQMAYKTFNPSLKGVLRLKDIYFKEWLTSRVAPAVQQLFRSFKEI